MKNMPNHSQYAFFPSELVFKGYAIKSVLFHVFDPALYLAFTFRILAMTGTDMEAGGGVVMVTLI
jgi:hypothetical protein